MEDLTGKQFGSYQIVAPLGEGGMAAVYKAYQPAMERYVAVKVLPRHMASSAEFVARFQREAKLLAQLQHPHILPVFDYGEADGYPYIVMPFVQGGTLAELLHKRRLSLPEIRRIMTQVGDALSYAHARGMIHRDIKPSNILIDERGNCLLTDFGLARMTEAATKLTDSGTVMGTPAYMSPEQGAGSDTDHRSDIYSLGIVLYEMVTGRVPYIAETPVAVVFKHIQDPLPSARKFNPSIPESVELILLKALAKTPDDRYQTAESFVDAIQRSIPESDSARNTPSQEVMSAVPPAYVPLRSEGQTVQPQTAVTRAQRSISRDGKPRAFPIWVFAGIGTMAVVVMAVFVVRSQLNTTGTPPAIYTPSGPANTTVPVSSPTPRPTATPTTVILLPPAEPFRDEFENQLAEGWTWLAEDPTKWSLSAVPGSLQIMAADASFDGPIPPPNVLVRDAPAGDFEMTTLLRFTPTSNFQFAGLVVFQDNGNVLQFGRAFCDVEGSCIGDGIYFDNYESGSFSGSNYKTKFSEPVVYLRVRRLGNTYTGYYSEDGENWIMIGEHIRDLSQVRVGLIAAQAPQEIPAAFDYFTMTSLSE